MVSEAIMIGLLLSWRDSRSKVVCLMIMTVKCCMASLPVIVIAELFGYNCYGQYGNCDLLVTATFFQQVALLTAMTVERFI